MKDFVDQELHLAQLTLQQASPEERPKVEQEHFGSVRDRNSPK